MEDNYIELNRQIEELENQLDNSITLEQKLKTQNQLIKNKRDLLYKKIEGCNYNALINIQNKETNEINKKLQELGISIIDGKGNYRNLKDILEDVTKKFKENNELKGENKMKKSTIEMEELQGKEKIIAKIEDEEKSATVTLSNKSFEVKWSAQRLRGFEFISAKQQLEDFKDDASVMQLKLPKRGTSKSAGYDIFAPYNITLQPNEEIKVPTGLKAYMQDGEVLMAFPRSGLGFGFYCRLANTVGVIDSDYYNNPKNEGHMFVKLRNEGTKEMVIKQGEGMCQMIFMPFLLADEDSFNEGETRQGGFGSTTK